MPGQWGGSYVPENVVHLCPNHHAAIHFLMRCRYRGIGELDEAGDERLREYGFDSRLMVLWDGRVQAVVIARMVKEGRWAEGARPLPMFVTEAYPRLLPQSESPPHH